MRLRPGQLVISRAGRDRGRLYLVARIIDERYVEVVDGKTRRQGNPKRKNIYHLTLLSKVARDIESKLLAGQEISDEEVREALRNLGNDLGNDMNDGGGR
ncbi:MAG TPA: RNA-binding protein [Firmicutes bacterium]|nr:RNA-binding protein [Bacillota bacterium]